MSKTHVVQYCRELSLAYDCSFINNYYLDLTVFEMTINK